MEALLNDLWEFYLQTEEKPDEEERENLLEKNKNLFYCLQPVVLYKDKDEQARENLLDGQQRLTTIYLLLSYLDSRRREEGYDKPLFTLEYATREDSADFLAKKLFASEESEVASNVDYHYMRAAYGYIKDWFTQAPKHPGAAGKLIPLLLDEDGKGPNVRVIEYYVEDDSDPIDVFLRLNQGKIPLTDAELTKALFLQSDKYDAKLLPYVSPKLDLIAGEWYAYEQQLSVPKFWHFISPYDAQSTPPSIRLLLELAARDLQSATSYKNTPELWESKKYTHPYYTIFSDYLQGYSGEERLKKIGEIWERIYTIFGLISEWYEDQELYHYVGYLMCTESSKRITLLRKLLKQAKTCTAPEFKASLRRAIGKKIERIRLNELSYEESQADIHQVLLLHNIHQHIFTSEQIRFPFDLYTKEKWSLEHIYAQQSEPLRNREEQIGFIEEHIATFREDAFGDDEETSSLIDELEGIRSQIQEPKKEESERVSLFEKALELITAFEVKHMGDTGPLHGLQNLCLLSRGVNSALSNRTFARKRAIMREIVMTATQEYIPMATRRVFLKYYSASPKDNAYWRREDAEAYMEHIRSVCKHYTSPSNAND
ncbi:PF03235 family protein [Porphyromonas sp. oral taxon 279 str. F0450]|nr:PF03235 family protein [Porphyromonas sp. oral taxon 279 str. F0450]